MSSPGFRQAYWVGEGNAVMSREGQVWAAPDMAQAIEFCTALNCEAQLAAYGCADPHYRATALEWGLA